MRINSVPKPKRAFLLKDKDIVDCSVISFPSLSKTCNMPTLSALFSNTSLSSLFISTSYFIRSPTFFNVTELSLYNEVPREIHIILHQALNHPTFDFDFAPLYIYQIYSSNTYLIFLDPLLIHFHTVLSLHPYLSIHLLIL